MRHTVLVTGGAGFIGSHVVDRLIARGHKVHVIDNLSSGDRRFVHPKAVLHVMDVRSPQLATLVHRLRPSRVVHLAAHIDLRESVRSPFADAEVNIMGSLNLLEACLAMKRPPHVVFASSAAVYLGLCRRPIPENYPLRPASPYGIAKLTFEHYLRFATETGGMKTAALRFANVYGPRQTVKGEAGVVAIFANLLLNEETATVYGDGRQTRDFVYVEDVAAAVVRASERSVQGTFNISTGKETSVNEMYKMIAAAAGSKKRSKHVAAKVGDERCVLLDPRQAAKTFGWKAKIEVSEGVVYTVEWATEQLSGGRKKQPRRKRGKGKRKTR